MAGPGSRYQARREIRSFWFPTWLAQPAALVANSKLIDAPPHGVRIADVCVRARDYDLVVLHTSTPSFAADVAAVEALKAANPNFMAGLIGAKVAVEADQSLRAAPAVDFVARNEFDLTIKEVAEGRAPRDVKGLSYRNEAGVIVHNTDRAVLENMDELPFVTPIYKRDLVIEDYFIGYLKHPYISLYTGRGCKSRCTFCLWPQTIGGHRYRARSISPRHRRDALDQEGFPQVKEIFFDDDTFTDNLPRIERNPKNSVSTTSPGRATPKRTCRARRSKVWTRTACGCCWSATSPATRKSCTTSRRDCSSTSRAASPRIATSSASRSTGRSSSALPGETKETIEETLAFAKEINPHTIQVSLGAPYPGTFLYNQARANGWLYPRGRRALDGCRHAGRGARLSASVAHRDFRTRSRISITKFYFRPGKIASIVGEMMTSPEMMKRRLREGVEFFHFLRERREVAYTQGRCPSAIASAGAAVPSGSAGTAPPPRVW